MLIRDVSFSSKLDVSSWPHWKTPIFTLNKNGFCLFFIIYSYSFRLLKCFSCFNFGEACLRCLQICMFEGCCLISFSITCGRVLHSFPPYYPQQEPVKHNRRNNAIRFARSCSSVVFLNMFYSWMTLTRIIKHSFTFHFMISHFCWAECFAFMTLRHQYSVRFDCTFRVWFVTYHSKG